MGLSDKKNCCLKESGSAVSVKRVCTYAVATGAVVLSEYWQKKSTEACRQYGGKVIIARQYLFYLCFCHTFARDRF